MSYFQSSAGFRGESLGFKRNFSWVFLVDWILTVILTLATLFYLSRAFAYGVTFILEWLLWKQAKVKVSIGALRISLLAGRVFFKNLTIIDKDRTITILEGSIDRKSVV